MSMKFSSLSVDETRKKGNLVVETVGAGVVVDVVEVVEAREKKPQK